MLEKVLDGDRRYWSWVLALLAVLAVGAATYGWQQASGEESSGLSRDVVWGFFIANDIFLVGVAASAVVVVLPYYVHGEEDLRDIALLGQILAVAAVAMALLFILADLGQPGRLWNMALHPTPQSPFFWNMIALPGYLLLNLVIAWFTLEAERNGVPVPAWVRPVVLVSIPWAISLHTLTAFVYSGLVARPFWNSAILAPRFLASAFASGPAALILLALVVRRFTRFDPGSQGIQKLAIIVTYATIVNLFLVFVELVVAVSSDVAAHLEHFRYAYIGLQGSAALAPWTWLSTLLALGSAVALLFAPVRRNERTLALACGAVFVSMGLDKGLCLVIGGFVPSPLGTITEYTPSAAELLMAAGVYAAGLLLLTGLYKMAVAVKEDI